VARNRVYADEVTYWSAAVAASPANPRALNNLGFALAGTCRLAEAEAAFVKAIALEPGGFRAAMNLSLLRAGEPLGPGEPRCTAGCDRGR
jgi:Flp pilus assembly protein TadD